MTRLMLLVAGVLLAVGATLIWIGPRSATTEGFDVPRIAAEETDPVARGAYLATAANCQGCHTVRGGESYAGGHAIPTPFGVFHGPNITPDVETGIGDWDADTFWRALHEGRGANGEPLYPVFPYTHYTRLSRDDSDALYAYLRSVPAVHRPNRAHELRFPYDQRWMLRGWRLLFFTPGVYVADTAQDDAWNRGAYLVQGLGHCGACHEARNAVGAVRSRNNPAGGVVLDWYAPALDVATEAGVAHWAREDVVALLRDGQAPGGTTLGPMAEVVHDSLQYLSAGDLDAMAAYLQALPVRDGARTVMRPLDAEVLAASRMRGGALYERHCVDCHGPDGKGRPPAASALVGNRAVTMDSPVNAIRVVLYGGFAPGTAGNPEPFGMPPFQGELSDQEVADLLNWLRAGAEVSPMRAHEVRRQRTGPLW